MNLHSYIFPAKQWSGLVKDYYLPRWELFFDYLQLELIDPGHFTYSQELFEETFLQEIGRPFTLARDEYPNEPSGDTIAIVFKAYEDWRPKLEEEKIQEPNIVVEIDII